MKNKTYLVIIVKIRIKMKIKTMHTLRRKIEPLNIGNKIKLKLECIKSNKIQPFNKSTAVHEHRALN